MNKGKITLMAVTGLILFILIIVLANSCSRVEPNYEGVLMTNYGRNGKEDFKSVTGRQNTFLPGTTLYQVPMFEQKGDPTSVVITAKDAGVFSVILLIPTSLFGAEVLISSLIINMWAYQNLM